ncbi:lysophospholipid acyltransferase family protein [Sulfuricurvum sp. RIFCSPLOWO2_12_FULL_43_24]|uniref:lysophospholipid acyltransferase family protein n=1 Tax=Sulfuricurvum sp. RIFCSPLOWO2_12_FULL_43_24 TaxID=1802247 RepID=UPI0008AAD3FA|nr:lysophospholipid acyltransferase family protein [Sulfuricurvum sp. RIFCSPLOWO2_12_FULL_43_24]OHD89455.1 MAG: glycerol acyltransferase [Sulfuricurvum sp. RIFCSPLOWO2_12_FULL_43_24]
MLKWLFFALIVRPTVLLIFGVHVRGRENLSPDKPSILVANHNSHLDTLVLMSLFPLHKIHRIRPVAAADYFMKNRLIAWFSTQFIGIIPLSRKVERSHTHPLESVRQALEAGDSIILFPEGSRGEAEQMSKFKSGVAHLAKMTPTVPVIPIYLGGAGKVLPKGEALLVPFIIDVHILEPMMIGEEDTQIFTQQLEEVIKKAGER